MKSSLSCLRPSRSCSLIRPLQIRFANTSGRTEYRQSYSRSIRFPPAAIYRSNSHSCDGCSIAAALLFTSAMRPAKSCCNARSKACLAIFFSAADQIRSRVLLYWDSPISSSCEKLLTQRTRRSRRKNQAGRWSNQFSPRRHGVHGEENSRKVLLISLCPLCLRGEKGFLLHGSAALFDSECPLRSEVFSAA